MKTLGIDPGYDRLGIAIVEDGNLLYSECFTTSKEDSHAERLSMVGKRISEVIERFKPDLLSIETLFFTKNQKTAMKVAESRGVALYEAKKNGLDVFELSPLQVKVAVTGYGKSDKSQVTMMVKKLLRIDKEKMKDDEYDAIAIAIAGDVSYPQLRKILQKK